MPGWMEGWQSRVGAGAGAAVPSCPAALPNTAARLVLPAVQLLCTGQAQSSLQLPLAHVHVPACCLAMLLCQWTLQGRTHSAASEAK